MCGKTWNFGQYYTYLGLLVALADRAAEPTSSDTDVLTPPSPVPICIVHSCPHMRCERPSATVTVGRRHNVAVEDRHFETDRRENGD